MLADHRGSRRPGRQDNSVIVHTWSVMSAAIAGVAGFQRIEQYAVASLEGTLPRSFCSVPAVSHLRYRP